MRKSCVTYKGGRKMIDSEKLDDKLGGIFSGKRKGRKGKAYKPIFYVIFMASNLIKIKGKETISNMNEIEIHPEEIIEKLLWENKDILPDIYLLSRQVPSYGGSDRIDILGLDSDNNVVIIEVKDEEVDENVILQVMRYAFWVETNPDSVKSLWYEKKREFRGD